MSWVLGACLCVLSCFVANFGLLLQKQALIIEKSNTDRSPRPNLRNPRWVCGFFFFILGQLISVWALSLTPQSVLGALSGCSLVSNSFLAPMLLGEVWTGLHMLSTLMLLIGSCFVVSFASPPADNGFLTMDKVLLLLIRPQAIGVFISAFVLIAFLFSRGKVKAITRSSAHSLTPRSATPADPFTFATTSAILGAFSVTMSKGVSTVLLTEYDQKATVVYHPGLLAMVVFGVACAVTGVYALNLGIQYFDALYIIPMYYSLALLFQSGFGGVIYDEFTNLDTYHAIGFIFGVVINVTGVWILSIANANDAVETPTPCIGRASTWHGELFDDDAVDLQRVASRKSFRDILKRSFSFDQTMRETPGSSLDYSNTLVHLKSVHTLDVVDEMFGQFADGGSRLWVLQKERLGEAEQSFQPILPLK